MIQQGQALPKGVLTELGVDGINNHELTSLFAEKRWCSLLCPVPSLPPAQPPIYLDMWF